jgi:tRNA uridine 5-carboxymethylaminomethyl modification enzyme
MYVNGLSTSLPPEVQLDYLRSVPGLERVEMTRPGYAIEYDYFPPTQLDRTLKVRGAEGLYFAGQVNGTTGYEEAAGQGAIAGLNAAASALEKPPVVFRRDQAFIGVLVDDLITRGVDEPYRLFTSRAEFRLLLRQDNALRRLYPEASSLGLLLSDERRNAEERLQREEDVLEYATQSSIHPDVANPLLVRVGSTKIAEPTRIAELARRPEVILRELLEALDRDFSGHDAEWAAIELHYRGYMDRERDAARRLAELESFEIPGDLEVSMAESLSFEAREKIGRVQPKSLGDAGSIPVVSPSDLQNLVFEIAKHIARRPTTQA